MTFCHVAGIADCVDFANSKQEALGTW